MHVVDWMRPADYLTVTRWISLIPTEDPELFILEDSQAVHRFTPNRLLVFSPSSFVAGWIDQGLLQVTGGTDRWFGRHGYLMTRPMTTWSTPWLSVWQGSQLSVRLASKSTFKYQVFPAHHASGLVLHVASAFVLVLVVVVRPLTGSSSRVVT